MGGVDDEYIHTRLDQRAGAITIIRGADRCRDAKTSVLILVRDRKIAALVDVLDRAQAAKDPTLVDDG